VADRVGVMTALPSPMSRGGHGEKPIKPVTSINGSLIRCPNAIDTDHDFIDQSNRAGMLSIDFLTNQENVVWLP